MPHRHDSHRKKHKSSHKSSSRHRVCCPGPEGPQGLRGFTGEPGQLDQTGEAYSDYLYWDNAAGKWLVGDGTVHLGANAGLTNQGQDGVAIGTNAAFDEQKVDAVAIGHYAGANTQSANAVAIGHDAGRGTITAQGASAIAIGYQAAYTAQGSGAIAIGISAGKTGQKDNAIAIGNEAGLGGAGGGQEAGAIAIGTKAGQKQGGNAVAIGNNAGSTAQSASAVSIGDNAGKDGQQESAIAIGTNAGSTGQNASAIAIGQLAGNSGQLENAIAIGNGAGQTSQGKQSIAIGYDQYGTKPRGEYSISIGANTFNGAGAHGAKSITINAEGTAPLTTVNASSLYITPIRSEAQSAATRFLDYNPLSKEITYNPSTDPAKTFIIDHPTDPDRYLVHACLEGPESGVYYRGVSRLTDGETWVELPPYVSSLARDLTVQLTQINSTREDAFARLWAGNVSGQGFAVYGDACQFAWHVYGTRGDIQTEPLRADVVVRGDGPYRYIQ